MDFWWSYAEIFTESFKVRFRITQRPFFFFFLAKIMGKVKLCITQNGADDLGALWAAAVKQEDTINPILCLICSAH